MPFLPLLPVIIEEMIAGAYAAKKLCDILEDKDTVIVHTTAASSDSQKK